MTKTIKSISYLLDDRRARVPANTITGKFRLRKGHISRRIRLKDRDYSYFTALTFVMHHSVKDNDPVLTLTDGDKIRVFQGGSSSQITATAHSYIEHHDSEYNDTTGEWPSPFDLDLGGW